MVPYSFALAIALGMATLVLVGGVVALSLLAPKEPAASGQVAPVSAPARTTTSVPAGQLPEALNVVPAFTATYHAEWLDGNGEHFNLIEIDFTSPSDWRQTTVDSDWPEQVGTFGEVTSGGHRLSNAVNGITDFTPMSEPRLPGAIMFLPHVEQAIGTGQLEAESGDIALVESLALEHGWQTFQVDDGMLTLTESGPAPPRKDWNPTGEGTLERIARFDLTTGLMLYHAWLVDGKVVSEIEMLDYTLK